MMVRSMRTAHDVQDRVEECSRAVARVGLLYIFRIVGELCSDISLSLSRSPG